MFFFPCSGASVDALHLLHLAGNRREYPRLNLAVAWSRSGRFSSKLLDAFDPVDHTRKIAMPLRTSLTTPSSPEAPRSVASINPEPLDAGDLTGTLAEVSLSLTFISDHQISIQ
jgi:hypothetical protein